MRIAHREILIWVGISEVESFYNEAEL